MYLYTPSSITLQSKTKTQPVTVRHHLFGKLSVVLRITCGLPGPRKINVAVHSAIIDKLDIHIGKVKVL